MFPTRHIRGSPTTHTHTHTWSIDKQDYLYYHLITFDSIKILRALKVGGKLTSANVDPVDARGQGETVEQQ